MSLYLQYVRFNSNLGERSQKPVRLRFTLYYFDTLGGNHGFLAISSKWCMKINFGILRIIVEGVRKLNSLYAIPTFQVQYFLIDCTITINVDLFQMCWFLFTVLNGGIYFKEFLG